MCSSLASLLHRSKMLVVDRKQLQIKMSESDPYLHFAVSPSSSWVNPNYEPNSKFNISKCISYPIFLLMIFGAFFYFHPWQDGHWCLWRSSYCCCCDWCIFPLVAKSNDVKLRKNPRRIGHSLCWTATLPLVSPKKRFWISLVTLRALIFRPESQQKPWQLFFHAPFKQRFVEKSNTNKTSSSKGKIATRKTISAPSENMAHGGKGEISAFPILKVEANLLE